MTSNKITAAQRRKIYRAVQALNDVLEDVQRTVPGANWYLADGENLYLLDGESHDAQEQPRFSAVIGRWDLKDSSGGGW